MCLANPDLKQIKAIIPAAGKGTRFYPFSKFIPKELLPVANRPAIDFIFDEVFDAKIEKTCIVCSPAKQLLIKYLKQSPISFDLANQTAAKGLGHAIFTAKQFFNEGSIIPVLLPDNIFWNAKNVTSRLIEAFVELKCCAVIAVGKVPAQQASRYGIIEIAQTTHRKPLMEIKSIVEKPPQGTEPSNLAVFGRYIFSNCIFAAAGGLPVGFGNEIQLTDAINKLISQGKKVYAMEISDKFLDVGNPQGWLEANQILFGHKTEQINSGLNSISNASQSPTL